VRQARSRERFPVLRQPLDRLLCLPPPPAAIAAGSPDPGADAPAVPGAPEPAPSPVGAAEPGAMTAPGATAAGLASPGAGAEPPAVFPSGWLLTQASSSESATTVAPVRSPCCPRVLTAIPFAVPFAVLCRPFRMLPTLPFTSTPSPIIHPSRDPLPIF